jgi:hypothetical protein
MLPYALCFQELLMVHTSTKVMYYISYSYKTNGKKNVLYAQGVLYNIIPSVWV